MKEEKDQKLKDLLEICVQNVHYIRNLVSKTIDLALLDSTIVGFTIEHTNLLSEVETVIENRAYLLQNHNILINNKIDDRLMVNADKIKLREVMNNLLINSIQYSLSPGGTITIDAFVENDQVVVSVTDTGVGLTQEQLDHIFDELYKADPARQNHRTTGLGLSICKRIIEKHGGKIWAQSPGQGKGTTVTFTLPSGSKK
jgi:signal transduction histidine kinase